MSTILTARGLAARMALAGGLAWGVLFLAAAPAGAQQAPASIADVAGVVQHDDDAAAVAADSLDAAAPAAEPAALQGQPPQGPQRPMFQDIRYDEDWSVLGSNPSLKGDLWDPIKFIRIDDQSYWSLGGEVRQRIDFWRNANFGYIPARNMNAVMNRYQFHADLHVNKNVRAFGQFASALEGGKKGGPWPTDRNTAEVHQAFLEVMGGPAPNNRWSLRLGRQEMAFGQSHFISTADFYNTRRAFDGVRLQATKGNLEFNAVVARPVQINNGAFDDDSDGNQMFSAASIFAPSPFTKGGRVALFYIGLTTHQQYWQRGLGRDDRHTIGLRMTGQSGHWDYVYEALLQRGTFANTMPIEAWATTTDTGYTFFLPRWGYPRVGVRMNIESGDAGRGALGTFNPMFPDVAYSGRIGLVGPANNIDITPNLRIALAPRVFFIPDFALFWRQKNTDAIYGTVTPYLAVPGNTSRERFIGGQLSLPMQINLTPHLTFTMAYGQLFRGAFLKQQRPYPAQSVIFLTNFLTYKF